MRSFHHRESSNRPLGSLTIRGSARWPSRILSLVRGTKSGKSRRRHAVHGLRIRSSVRLTRFGGMYSSNWSIVTISSIRVKRVITVFECWRPAMWFGWDVQIRSNIGNRPSATSRRMDFYGPRNAVLFVWQNVPWPAMPVHLAATTLNCLRWSLVPAAVAGADEGRSRRLPRLRQLFALASVTVGVPASPPSEEKRAETLGGIERRLPDQDRGGPLSR